MSELSFLSLRRLPVLLSAILIATIMIVSLLVPTSQALGVVTLVSFTGTVSGSNVALHWITATELDTVGFNIRRNTTENYSTSTRINADLIVSEFGGASGATYEYLDPNMPYGRVYYYWLEDLSSSNTITAHGPILVGVGAVVSTPTATPTLTKTTTSTAIAQATVLAQVSTATATPTTTSTATATATSGTSYPPPVATSTPRPFATATRPSPPTGTSRPVSPTPSETVIPTATTTLEPLPSLELLFPSVPATSTPTAASSPIAGNPSVAEKSSPAPEKLKISPQVGLLGGFIMLIWLLLGAFLFVYLKKIGTPHE